MRPLVFLLALSLPSVAHAEEPPAQPPLLDRSFTPHVLLRLGHYAPIGDAYDDQSLGDYAGNATVFFLGAGARVKRVTVDMVFGIGGASGSEASRAPLMDSGFDAGGNLAFSFGLEGTYHLRRGSRERYFPWVGGGVGYEAFGPGGSRGDEHLSIKHSGPALRWMAGVDLPTTPWFGHGLAAELGTGWFTSHSATYSVDDDITTFENEAYSETQDLDLGTGMHAWAGLSVRAVFFP